MSVHLDALAEEVFSAAAAQALGAAVIERFSFGEIRKSTAYPDLSFLNGIAELRAADWSVADLEQALDDNLPGIGNARVSSRDPETIARLGPRLVEAGFESECRVAMVQVEPPDGPAAEQIRVVETAADWTALERLVREDASGHSWSSPVIEQLVALYREGSEEQSWLLGSLAGEDAGYVGLYQHGTTAYLHALYTRPNSRRRGTGSALVRKASNLARSIGCERLTLQCARDSFLPGFYQRLGFRVVGEVWIWAKPA